MTKLSILILTIPARKLMLDNLITELRRQMEDKPVEILINVSPDKTIGAKRNALLKKAEGDYVVFIDDDDLIARDYIDRILEATETNPDCIGISGIIIPRGKKHRPWHISMDYKEWFEKNEVYYRSPNHISPVKRSIALKAMFPEINHGEDKVYSERIYPLLKTEVRIEGCMYTYRYNSKK